MTTKVETLQEVPVPKPGPLPMPPLPVYVGIAVYRPESEPPLWNSSIALKSVEQVEYWFAGSTCDLSTIRVFRIDEPRDEATIKETITEFVKRRWDLHEPMPECVIDIIDLMRELGML